MILPRTTVCTLFSIGSPRWNGESKRRQVGLATHRLTRHNEVEFTYTRKTDGRRSIPEHYYFDGSPANVAKYEKQIIKGVTLVIVSLNDLEVLERGTSPTEEITDPNKMPPLIKKVFFDPPDLPVQEKLSM